MLTIPRRVHPVALGIGFRVTTRLDVSVVYFCFFPWTILDTPAFPFALSLTQARNVTALTVAFFSARQQPALPQTQMLTLNVPRYLPPAPPPFCPRIPSPILCTLTGGPFPPGGPPPSRMFSLLEAGTVVPHAFMDAFVKHFPGIAQLL